MAINLQASQISTNITSWYQRLRTVQGKTPQVAHGSAKITQTTDPSIKAGTEFTASQVNAFITALTSSSVKNNVFLSYANWSAYQPSAVTKGQVPSQANVYDKINNMLTSLETVNANYSYNGDNATNSTNTTALDCDTCNEYGTNGHNSNDGTNSTCTTNSTRATYTFQENPCEKHGVDGNNATCARDTYNATNTIEGDCSDTTGNGHTCCECQNCGENGDHGDFDHDGYCSYDATQSYDSYDMDCCGTCCGNWEDPVMDPEYDCALDSYSPCSNYGYEGADSTKGCCVCPDDTFDGNTCCVDGHNVDKGTYGQDGTISDSVAGDSLCGKDGTADIHSTCGNDTNYGETSDSTCGYNGVCSNNTTQETCSECSQYQVI